MSLAQQAALAITLMSPGSHRLPVSSKPAPVWVTSAVRHLGCCCSACPQAHRMMVLLSAGNLKIGVTQSQGDSFR